jgi:hypothetical protein
MQAAPHVCRLRNAFPSLFDGMCPCHARACAPILDGDTKSVGHGTLKSEKTLRTEQTKHTNAQSQAQFTRAPSEKSTNSRWSAVKGSLKDLKQNSQITRAPSDKSSKSRWSLVKDQVSQRTISETGGGASLAGKTNQAGEFGRPPSNASQAFGRVPSNASQAKSRWSDVKSRLSAGRSIPLFLSLHSPKSLPAGGVSYRSPPCLSILRKQAMKMIKSKHHYVLEYSWNREARERPTAPDSCILLRRPIRTSFPVARHQYAQQSVDD